ncbi:hypothetical protein TWF281_000104 [Arthrobotrys megalospora]
MASTEIFPTDTASFLSHVAKNDGVKPLRKLVGPYLEYESKLRALFAQDPSNEALADNTVGLVPIYAGEEAAIKIQAREPEPDQKKSQYLMELDSSTRKTTGERAIVDLEDFKRNFSIFTEDALQGLDWSNIVAAGSSVLTPILAVPEEHRKNKRTLRDYYHQVFAPTSDIDLFIYGIQDEQAAIERMTAIEATIRSNLLWKATSVRTKNTITIISKYPNRHVQIVLRLYSSISEILTGFDVSCACVAYDGQQVYANPRAIVSWMLQCNDIDLTRRSPSYEFRLAKYRKRGFEVYYPDLQRDKIDPTIYERNIVKLKGLAKLLLLERLPDADQRDAHLSNRRAEQGRPMRSRRRSRYRRSRKGKEFEALKTRVPEVPEWDVNIVTTSEAWEESNYYTITLPYGEDFPAKKTERLIYESDMLLNTKHKKGTGPQKDRVGYLHRHPAFVGSVKYIVGDCCGSCPEPKNDEERELQAQDDKFFVRGPVTFIRDDPGRQEIGSFNPRTEDDWTHMAYLSENEIFFRAIASNDVEGIKKWISTVNSSPSPSSGGENDINRRDHTGRTALHLAVTTSTPEVVKLLLDSGVKLTRRVADGRTALHMAAARGDLEIIKLLLLKSQENEEIQSQREDLKRRKAQEDQPSAEKKAEDDEDKDEDKGEDKDEEVIEGESDGELIDDDDDDEPLYLSRASVSARTRASSFVGISKKIDNLEPGDDLENQQAVDVDAEEDGDILDINVPDWDHKMSPIHYAIVNGYQEILKLLVSDFGADVLQPVKTEPPILTIPLAMTICQKEQREGMLRTLLKAGASSAQVDTNGVSAFTRILELRDLDCLKILFEEDAASALTAAKNIVVLTGHYPVIRYSLLTAIEQSDEDGALFLLEKGVPPELTLETVISKSGKQDLQARKNLERHYKSKFKQPAEIAIDNKLLKVFMKCIELGVNPSSYAAGGYPADDDDDDDDSSDYYNSRQRRFASNSYSNNNNQKTGDKKRGFTLLDKIHQKVASVDNERNQSSQGNRNRRGLFGRSSYDSDDYSPPRNPPKKKSPLRELIPMPKNYTEGTYEFWMASQLVGAENAKRESDNERIRKENAGIAESAKSEEPEEDAEAPKNPYRELAEWLVSKGGKPYQEDFLSFTYGYRVKAKVSNAYHELFKAVWDGDREAVKKYTSPSWGEAGDETPLLIAISNQLDYTLFSVAVYRKHPNEFLDFLLDIAAAQCRPVIIEDDNSSSEDSNSDDFNDDASCDDSESENAFGRGSVPKGEVLTTTTPVNIIHQNVASVFVSHDMLAKQTGTRQPLLMQAAVAGRVEFFNYLTSALERLGGTPNFSTDISPQKDNEITVSIRRQHLEVLSTILQISSFGAFSSQKKVLDNDPDVYRGLSIHGKKQNGWGNPVYEKNNYGTIIPSDQPAALLAAHYGSHKVYEWLETDGAKIILAKYQKLQEEPEGPKAEAGIPTFQTWLGIDHPLLLHAIVLNPGPASNKNLSEEEKLAWYEKNMKYFLSKQPSLLESKENSSGLTPLLLAAQSLNKYALQVLINFGANLYAVAPESRLNIVHLILNNSAGTRKDVDEMLTLLPQDFKRWAFSQRVLYNDVEYTALSYLLSEGKEMVYDTDADIHANIIPLLLKHSDNAGLGIGTTLGDLPVHLAVKQSSVESLQCIVDASAPKDLVTENANGVTVLQLAQAMWYQSVIKSWPPSQYESGPEPSRQKPSRPETEEEIELRRKREALAIVIRNEEWGIDEKDSDEVERLKMVDTAVKKALGGDGAVSRVLVSVREANEKAERLEKRQKMGMKINNGSQDIVTMWSGLTTRGRGYALSDSDFFD